MRPTNTRSRGPVRTARAVLAALALLAGAAHPAAAQRVVPGFARVNQSDVSGAAVTSGDLASRIFEPGTLKSMTCPVAWGVRTRERELLGALGRGELPAFGAAPDSAAQERLARLLRGGRDGEAAAEEYEAALAGAGQGLEARRAARRLVRSLRGLDGALAAMDPAAPGVRGPTRLAAALARYNDFVLASSPAFLGTPSPEMRAVHALLSGVSVAALENAGREADVRGTDEYGLACAAPAPPPAPVRAVSVCMLVGGAFLEVAGLVGEDGDTLAVVNGARVPFRQVHPEDRAGYAADRAWFWSDEPLELRGEPYRRFGMARPVRPEEVERVGEYRGVGVFRLRGEDPATLYLPAAHGCEVQPFRLDRAIGRVKGG